MAIFGDGPGYQTATVASTATQIYNISASGVAVGVSGMIVVNNGPQKIYVGLSGVTTATGTPLAAGRQMHIGGPAVNLYAITASATSFAEVGLATVASNV